MLLGVMDITRETFPGCYVRVNPTLNPSNPVEAATFFSGESHGTGPVASIPISITPSPPAPTDTFVFLPSDRASGSSSLLIDISANGTTLLSVRGSGLATSSTDGLNWTNLGSSSGNIFSHAFGAGLLVGVGFGGDVESSPDGNVWTPQSVATSQNLWSIIFADSQFVAVGDSGTIINSTDGSAWNVHTSGSTDFRGVAFGNGIFIGVGKGGGASTSPNGSSWTIQSTGAFDDFAAICYSSDLNLFVAVGANGLVATTSDGVTWDIYTIFTLFDIHGDPQPPNTTDNFTGVTFGNSKFAMCSEQGNVFTSTDGTYWTLAATDPHIALKSEARIYYFQSGTWLVLETNPPI